MKKICNNGLFITFEGGEGSGKTSVIKVVEKKLVDLGYEVILTREPGGIKIAEQIRTVILDKDNTDMEPETEALLFAASRTEHLMKKVFPALKEGKVVLCDRYLDSSLVYQGITRGLGLDMILKANCFACECLPKRTYFLDVTPKVGLSRIQQRGDLNRLDLEDFSFHEKVYNGYIELTEMFPDRIKRINGEQDIELVAENIFSDIKNILK